MKIIKAKKDLITDSGERSFTKGKEYDIVSDNNIKEKIKVLDDQGDVHVLGIWDKHFTYK